MFKEEKKIKRIHARPQTQVGLAQRPVLLNQRTHSVLDLPLLLPLKMWQLGPFLVLRKGSILSTGQREDWKHGGSMDCPGLPCEVTHSLQRPVFLVAPAAA